MKSLPLALAVACAAAVSAAPAAAQMDDIVRQQLEFAVGQMAEAGYSPQGEFRSGAIRGGGEETIRVELQAGTTYAIVGVCDADCSDMDLFLSDPSGRLLTQDIEEDDVPIVQAEVTRTGSYQLRITMPACSVDPCGYGIAVFAQS